MGEVVGPIIHEDWCTMIMLKNSINWLKNNNKDGSRKGDIAKEQHMYREFLDPYLKKEA